MFVVSIFFIFFALAIDRLLTLQTPRLGSCHATFHSSLTVKSYIKIVKYILTNRSTALGVYSVLLSTV